MEILYNNYEYAQKLVSIAQTFPTYYGWGAFGAPASYKNNKTRYDAAGAPNDAFLFDCSGFVYKAVPWGWYGDRNRVYGGAEYKKKGFEALETSNILAICSGVSSDFSNIEVGEVLYMSGHVGLYIGNGKCVECTSKWTNGCIVSEVQNCGISTGLPYKRTWLKHGKLPFLNYITQPKPEPTPVPDNGNKDAEVSLINDIRKKLDELEAML